MIEASEARGQRELSDGSQLPSDISGDKAELEKDGVVFGQPSVDDPLFLDVTLPDGWKIERTDHSMWSKLIDANGRERASIFYKAAFYDRRAFMNVRASATRGKD